MEKNERKGRILIRVGAYGPDLTAKDIASLEGMSKSPHFVGLLQELVDEGYLICKWAKHANRQTARFFSLPSQK